MKSTQLLLLLLLTLFLPQASYAVKTATTPATENVVRLDKQERKALKKEAKAERKELRQQLKETFRKTTASDNTLLLVIIAIFLPWLAVLLHQGKANGKFWLSLLLWLLFYLPGLIYALIVIL